jgi:membrane peptidoglycan carboxypeptidase
MRLLRFIISLAAGLVGVGLLLSLIYVASIMDELPSLPERLSELESAGQTRIVDRNGLTIAETGSGEPVVYQQISPLFIQCLLATEDSRFMEHHGIDKRALLRVVVSNLTAGRRSGGSTLTQQLAKNLFLSFEKKVDRKLREMLLALQMEARYSKQEILTAYCNTVNFGSGCFGVERASREYFGKHASELNLQEAATLVGVLNAPSRYHPRIRTEACVTRRNWVLKRARAVGMISQARMEELSSTELTLIPAQRDERGHLRDYILGQVEDAYLGLGLDPASIPYSGLEIRSTIDLRLQDLAQRQTRAVCRDLETRLGANATSLDGAVVMLDPASGEVLAMVGGRDYAASAYNCALSPNRQPGSCFKPLLYYSALRAGRSPLDLMVDSLRTFDLSPGSWTPQNWDGSQSGRLTLAYALMKSLNIVMAQVIMEDGADGLVQTAREAGITVQLDPQPSLALGSSPVPPFQLGAAYATLVNRGVYSKPFALRKVVDSHGRQVLEMAPDQHQALDDVTSYLVVDALKGAVRYGTGRSLGAIGYPGELGGKTGTTNDYRDSWFCAVTPNLVTVCWVGNRDNRPMRFNSRSGVTGAGGGLKIFAGILAELASLRSASDVFTVPEEISFMKVDLASGEENPEGARLALRPIDY